MEMTLQMVKLNQWRIGCQEGDSGVFSLPIFQLGTHHCTYYISGVTWVAGNFQESVVQSQLLSLNSISS